MVDKSNKTTSSCSINTKMWPTSKPETMSCGLACVSTTLLHIRGYGLESNNNADIHWSTDIGSELLQAGFDVFIYAYKSQLLKPLGNIEFMEYREIISNILKMDLEPILQHGYKSLLQYISLGGILQQKKITAKEIEASIFHGLPVILCVSSGLFHEDPSMTGGHFIIVVGFDWANFMIVSPGKISYNFQVIKKNNLLNALYSWGGWSIFIQARTE
jgi:hypothetical protein